MTDSVHEIVAKVFGISVSDITDQSGPENTDVKTVADIKRHLKNHDVSIDE